MYLFGLKRIRPPAAARIGGLRFLRIGRREAKSAGSEISYLRHASAMSAAIAKNMTTIMSQPSELVHGTSKSDQSSFLDAHYHYSFIIVVALMSLFLVLTISATGLLLAFCRKKNTVFVAAPKPDADSQFELDDIDNSDIEMCRGDKGECYFHLSENYEDDDDDDDDYNEKNKEKDKRRRSEEWKIKIENKPTAKRSAVFPFFNDILKRCSVRSNSRKRPDLPISGRSLTESRKPIVNSFRNVADTSVGNSEASADKKTRKLSISEKRPSQMRYSYHQGVAVNQGHAICRNPNHRHHYHHYNFPPTCHHQRQLKLSRSGRAHVMCLNRCHLPYYAAGKLQRSHTIHAIPLTERKNHTRAATSKIDGGVQSKFHNDKVNPTEADTTNSITSSPRAKTDMSEIDIFVDEDDEVSSKTKSSFDKLRLEIDREKGSDNDSNCLDTRQAEVTVHTCLGQVTYDKTNELFFKESKVFELSSQSENCGTIQNNNVRSLNVGNISKQQQQHTLSDTEHCTASTLSLTPLGTPEEATDVTSASSTTSFDATAAASSPHSDQDKFFQAAFPTSHVSSGISYSTYGRPFTPLTSTEIRTLKTPSLVQMHILPPPKSSKRQQPQQQPQQQPIDDNSTHKLEHTDSQKNRTFCQQINTPENIHQSLTSQDDLTDLACAERPEIIQSLTSTVTSDINDKNSMFSENLKIQYDIQNSGSTSEDNVQTECQTFSPNIQEELQKHSEISKSIDDVYDDDDDDQTIALLK